MATEQRISRLEGAYEQVDARLSDTNQRIDSLSSRVNALQANTLTILTVGGWVALMAAIVALFFAK
jgi:chromosome segregation ATPase